MFENYWGCLLSIIVPQGCGSSTLQQIAGL
jgi:hypothetical protein